MNLGYIYRKGYKGIVDKNNKKAIKYYSMAASKGNKIAQFNLGVLYLKGDDDVPIDIEKSIHFLKLAVYQNYLDAELNLGVSYAKEEEIHSSNFNKSTLIFDKLSKLNNKKAKHNLDIIHSKKYIRGKELKGGKIVETEEKTFDIEPKQYIKNASAHEEGKVGDFLINEEKELDENEFELCYLYNENKNNSSPKNQFENLYESLNQKILHIESSIEVQNNQVNNDFSTALGNLYTQFINIGLTDCINTYTKVNNSLQIVENEIHTFLSTENIYSHLPSLKKETTAHKVLEKENNDKPKPKKITLLIKRHEQFNEDNSKTSAQAKLVSNQPDVSIIAVNEPLKGQIDNSPRKKINESNLTIPKKPSPCSLKNKIEILKRNSEEGDAISQMQLGACYSRGEGVSRDESIAFDYFLKAANQGNKDAQFIVGTCYSYGKGTDKNLGFQFYLKSAEQGYHKAQLAVGHFYLYNKEWNRENHEKAHECYRKAASQGNRAAIKAIQNLTI